MHFTRRTLTTLLAACPIYTVALPQLGLDITIPTDFTSLLPQCASACFQTFVTTAFPQRLCGSSPSVDCLCEHSSPDGLTIGEGAVRCIVSEAVTGFCSSQDSSQQILDQAYGMCDGDPKAAPETHATLTATLAPISNHVSGVVLVAST